MFSYGNTTQSWNTHTTEDDFYELSLDGFEGKTELDYVQYANPVEDNFSNIFCLPKTKIPGIHMNTICDVAIGTQNPRNIPIFWTTVCENNITTIVNLHKEFTYRPDNCEVVEEWNGKITVYRVKLQHNDTEHIVHIIHYFTWPDHGVPDDAECLMAFKLFFKYFTSGKFAVHCRAGIGRTGAFLAIYYAVFGTQQQLDLMLQDYPELKFTSWKTMSTLEIVKLLRTRRLHLVQSYSQFNFCAKFIAQYEDELLSYVPKPIVPEVKPEELAPEAKPEEEPIIQNSEIKKIVIKFKTNHFSEIKRLRNKMIKNRPRHKNFVRRPKKHYY
jgi:hypothetical protein